MSEQTDPKGALLSLLQKMGLQTGVPISLYMIRPPLISQGFSQDRIVFALYELKMKGVIDLLTDNRLLLMKFIYFAGWQMANRVEKIECELGRKKLMMKLPVLRDLLRQASGDQIDALFVAYERASARRDRVRAHEAAPAQWTNYSKEVLKELEDKVEGYFAAQRWQDFS